MERNPVTLRSLLLEMLSLGQAEHMKEITKHLLTFRKLMLGGMALSYLLLSNDLIIIWYWQLIKSYILTDIIK